MDIYILATIAMIAFCFWAITGRKGGIGRGDKPKGPKPKPTPMRKEVNK